MNWRRLHETLRYEEVEEALGLDITTRLANGEHSARCPLPSHGGPDRNPSFGLNIRKGVWSCFACGVGGHIPKLVQEILGLSYIDALDWLAQYSDFAADAFLKELEGYMDKKPPVYMRKMSLPWFPQKALPAHEQGAESFFEKRNITEKVRKALGLRYASSHGKQTYFGPCIIIPHVFEDELRGWQERWMDFGRKGFPSYIGKYTNSSEFPRSHTLYNFDRINPKEAVILVESALTVATLESYGYQAIASFGAFVSEEQLKYLASLPSIYVAYDNDGPGEKSVQRIVERLGHKSDVWVVPTPSGEKADLGDLTKTEVDDLIRNAELSDLLLL